MHVQSRLYRLYHKADNSVYELQQLFSFTLHLNLRNVTHTKHPQIEIKKISQQS